VRDQCSNMSSEPLTNDVGANEFAAKVGLNMEVEQQVRALDMPMRVRVPSVSATKMQQTAIQIPSTYLAVMIRNENCVQNTALLFGWCGPFS
jgi:hypothetical protein